MKRRHVVAVLLLSYLTLGIYTVYWLYRTRLDLLQYTPDKNAIPRVIIMFIPFFALIAAVLMALLGSAVAQGDTGAALGTAVSILATVLVLASILALFIVSFWWFYRYFQVLEQVVQGNDGMLYYTLWVILTLFGLGPVWVILVQSDLNKFIDNNYQPLRVPMQPNYQPPAAPQVTAHPQPAEHQTHHTPHQPEHGHHPHQPHQS